MVSDRSRRTLSITLGSPVSRSRVLVQTFALLRLDQRNQGSDCPRTVHHEGCTIRMSTGQHAIEEEERSRLRHATRSLTGTARSASPGRAEVERGLESLATRMMAGVGRCER